MTEEDKWSLVESCARKSNCKKRNVGCVVFDSNWNVIAYGYNYHQDGVCDCGKKGEGTAIHAEDMAASNMFPYKEETVAYVNHKPCDNCVSELNKKGVYNIVVNSTSKRLDDPVRPSHYPKGSFEMMRESSTSEEFKGYCRLTAMKYLVRLNHKDTPIINAKKAQFFLNALIKELEDEDDK